MDKPILHKGIKFDIGKDQWNLLPLDVLREVVRVLMHGAKKYSPDNWKSVAKGANGKQRYFDAAMRHIVAYQNGEQLDESGHTHLAHAICCLIFLLWAERECNE
jgi:hypothetical protein